MPPEDNAPPVDEAPTPSLMDEAAAAPAGDPPAGDPPAGDPPADPPAGDPPTDDKSADEGDKPEPIEYEDFSTPDGVTLDEAVLGEFKDIAKELGLPQDKAQKFVDMATTLQQKQADAFAEQVVAARAEWREGAKADPEFGGAKLTENLRVAVAAREEFGTPELKTLLDDSGLGDHPEVIRFFYRVGTAVSDHAFAKGDKPLARRSFYDHPSSKPKG